MSDSRPRQNFSSESEAAINEQINLELHASYVYMSMDPFDPSDLPPYVDKVEGQKDRRDPTEYIKALPGMKKFFKERADEEKVHAEKLMDFQNKRGGRIVLKNIEKPTHDEWGTALDAVETALHLEKKVNQSLINLEKTASKNGDAQMADYICQDYLSEQVDDIKKLSDMITNLQRVGGGLGEYLFDKNLS